jgi:hypothetical protein
MNTIKHGQHKTETERTGSDCDFPLKKADLGTAEKEFTLLVMYCYIGLVGANVLSIEKRTEQLIHIPLFF